MSAKAQTQAQATTVATPAFTAAQTGLLQRECACGGTPGVDGECAECRAKRLQRNATNPAGSPTVPPLVHEVLRSPGKPLDAGTRAFMEPRFGHDFSNVRVHTDTPAADASHVLNAKAFTNRQHIFFGAGRYQVNTAQGQHLLAHELVHTIQQQRSLPLPQNDVQSSDIVSQGSEPLEQEADTVASQVGAGQPASLQILSPVTHSRLQRDSLWDDVKSVASGVGEVVGSTVRAVGRFVSSNVEATARGITSLGQNVANTLTGSAQRIEKIFTSLAELLGIPKPVEGDPATLDIIVRVLQNPLVRALPGYLLPDWLVEKLEQARSFLSGAWQIMQNPDLVIQSIKSSIEPMIAQIPDKSQAIVRKSVTVPEYFEGVWRHLEPKIDYLLKNWWQVIKDTAWTLLWPWPSVWASLKDIWKSIKSAASNLWDLKFSKALDDVLAIWRGANDVAGNLYGWFFIASILVGTIVGAFFGGAGAIPGAAAGLGVALEVGKGLLISLLAAETASISKASSNLFAGDQTEEEEEQEFEQIASSSFTLAITGVMALIGEIAYRFARGIIGFVRGLFRREPTPRINVQKLAGHVSDTPQYKNRIKFSKPTSAFDGDMAEAEKLTQTAWKNGKTVKGRPGVRDYDFGRRIGTDPNGKPQTKVRVHKDATGIHGHPVGRATPAGQGAGAGGVLGGNTANQTGDDDE